VPEATTLKLQLNVAAGALTEPRYRNLLKELGEDRYSQFAPPSPAQPLAILSNPQERSALILAPDALIIQAASGPRPAFELAVRDLEAACRGLLLEPTGTGGAGIIKTYDYRGNSLDDSLSWTSVPKADLLSWATSLAGIGLKLYVRSYGEMGEVRVEPLLADPRQVYVDATINYSQPVSAHDLGQRAQDFWDILDESVIPGLIAHLHPV
jgi:hypothetical protein